MTDKQIIIDGVDVSECPAMNTYNILGIKDKPCCYKFHKHCSTIPNCYFKELKRAVHKLQTKEQECEELKEERNEYFELMAIRTEVLAKIANKLGMNTGIIENNELFCKIDQLKAENEELRNSNINLVGVKERDIRELLKLKQTLAEIKGICNEYQKEYILNIGVEILTNKILQII